MVVPAPTAYHRWLGWHAPDLRRLATAGAVGLAVGVGVALFLPWQLTVLGAWDAAALVFLGSVWPIILRADAAATRRLVTREDVTRGAARLLLASACGASLVAVAFALHLAGLEQGGWRAVFIAGSTLTVVVSWIVLNTVFTLRYAADYYSEPPDAGDRDGSAIDFGGAPASVHPDYRDLAYVAFTIGMTYQVSDTNLRNRRIRRTVLVHAILSYLFGVIILAAGVNIVAGLVN
jgi:uncharacterized membrane protein